MIVLTIARNVRTLALASTAICGLLFGHSDLSVAVGGPGYFYEPSSEQNVGTLRLKACSSTSNCVSSNYAEPPNRYISPLKIVNDRDTAFQRTVRDVQTSDFVITEVISKDYYIHLTTAGTAPGSIDDVELVIPEEGGIVNMRCEARVTLPPPPFCVKKNCINGNMDQRSRLKNLMNILGLPSADETQMQGAKWTPIFFNSDRVPGFYDNY
uniref:Uncharacterized protein n=1 Tax=Chaetoceros debilis TaxID=122233 RepID=A0A7S3Q1F2_9STRA